MSAGGPGRAGRDTRAHALSWTESQALSSAREPGPSRYQVTTVEGHGHLYNTSLCRSKEHSGNLVQAGPQKGQTPSAPGRGWFSASPVPIEEKGGITGRGEWGGRRGSRGTADGRTRARTCWGSPQRQGQGGRKWPHCRDSACTVPPGT